MPRCQDLAIFVVTTTDRQIDCFTLAHAHGVIINYNYYYLHLFRQFPVVQLHLEDPYYPVYPVR